MTKRLVPCYPWKASFTIPFAEAVHTMIHAFLRTSQAGSWVVNPKIASDGFVLNYQRAKDNSSPSMQLKITLRPTPELIVVKLECRLTSTYFIAMKSWED